MKYRINFLPILFLSIFLLSKPCIVFGQTILFQDNFNDGNTNKWDVIGNSGWNIQNGEYGIKLTTVAKSNAVPASQNWNNNWNHYVFKADLRGVSGTDKNLVFHFVDALNFYDLHHTGGQIWLVKYFTNNPAGILLAPPLNYPLENGIIYHFEIDVDGDHIRISVNDHLLFDVIDSDPKIIGGKIGLRAGTGSVRLTEVWFDNVVVTEIITLPSLNVPPIKQTDPLWKDKIYDHALTWTQADPTINRWGCALTSASMVLKYYGFTIASPDLINNWLINQSDGYIRNGLVNWLALSRFTKLYSTAGQPVLEYKQFRGEAQILVNELENSKPSILEEPGHFVVAKSQLPSSFGINDPYYDNRVTLDSYNNSFLSLGSYSPSHTDLSYLFLVVDETIDLRVFSLPGEKIMGETFIQNPLLPDPDLASPSGIPLKIFLLPKPVSTDYKVVLSGNGNYQLDSYIYDREGNVSTNSFSGNISENQQDHFIVSIAAKRITKEITLSSLMNDLDTAYRNGLFKNFGLYNAIKQLLSNALKLQNRKN